MFSNNEAFENFRKALEAKGVTVRWQWAAKRWPFSKGNDVAFVTFHGNGFTPSITEAVVIDHEPHDGFALFYEGLNAQWMDDVKAIATPRGEG